MGYYPPYFPDSYLQTMRGVPPIQHAVQRIEPVSPKVINVRYLNKHRDVDPAFKRWEGKGFYFDQYV